MPKCKYHEICGLDGNTEEDLCILHSQNPEKNEEEFDKALAVHRQKNGHKFQHFVFPGRANFREVTFTEWASFFYSRFTRGADFSEAMFSEGADFSHSKFAASADFFGVTFGKGAKFSRTTFCKGTFADFGAATFAEWADFSDATFGERTVNSADSRFTDQTGFADAAIYAGGAKFRDAKFNQEAYFQRTIFTEEARFGGATFTKGADFSGATFGKEVEFSLARFLGRTRFLSRKENGTHIPIFCGTLVSFREVDVAPDAVVFRDADLRKCHFLGTDLRKIWIAGEPWPEIVPRGWPQFGRRFGVYDEIWAEQKSDNHAIPHIEELYRQLKQNYEDRRDYERARHFHIGEKEMRRKNSRGWLWILLTVYRWVSGYGESCLLPLFWASVLLAATTAAYFWGGLLVLNKEANSMLSLTRIGDVGLYSLRVMTLLKPNEFIPTWFWGNFVNWIQSIFGPLLFALFALALRQRLKR